MSLTKLGASHEVVACLFGVSAMYLTGFWVELGEHVSMEAIMMLHKAESRCAVWHRSKLFLIDSLGLGVVVVDVVSLRENKVVEMYSSNDLK